MTWRLPLSISLSLSFVDSRWSAVPRPYLPSYRFGPALPEGRGALAEADCEIWRLGRPRRRRPRKLLVVALLAKAEVASR